MYKILFTFLFAAAASASELDETQANQRSGFSIQGLKIYHQEEWRNMTLTLEYESGKELDVKGRVKQFLADYDKPADFWEIMNVKLTRSLIEKYPEITALKTKISLAPDRTLLFPRASTVQYDHSPVLKEFFEFTKLNYRICNETFQMLDFHISFQMKENPGPFDYPDYQWLDQAMDEYFKERPLSFSKWSEIKPELEGYLLERFPTVSTLNIDVTIAS